MNFMFSWQEQNLTSERKPHEGKTHIFSPVWIILFIFTSLHAAFFVVHTVSTARNEWIHWRRTKNPGSYSVWNGKPGNSDPCVIKCSVQYARNLFSFNLNCHFLLLLSSSWNMQHNINGFYSRRRRNINQGYLHWSIHINARCNWNENKDHVDENLLYFSGLTCSLCVAFQLKLNKLEKNELDASLRNKSEKYEELVEEVKHSR